MKALLMFIQFRKKEKEKKAERVEQNKKSPLN